MLPQKVREPETEDELEASPAITPSAPGLFRGLRLALPLSLLLWGLTLLLGDVLWHLLSR